MEISSEDVECNKELVVPAKQSVPGEQGRLPFQSLCSGDGSNKKRKQISPLSPGHRSAKLVKITTKENACDNKSASNDSLVIVNGDQNHFVESDVDKKEETHKAKETDSKQHDSSNESDGNKNNKKASAKSTPKGKKSEVKIQSNSLTKFFKLVDSSEIEKKKQNDATNYAHQTEDKNESDSDVLIIEDKCNGSRQGTQSNFVEEVANSDSKDQKINSNGKQSNQEQNKVIELMDVDSEVPGFSDDSLSESVQSSSSKRSDTDDKRPEADLKPCSVTLKKLTPRQHQKKLEQLKRREQRELKLKQLRMEKEQKIREERERKQKEKDEKKREREEKEQALKEQKRKEREEKEAKKRAEIEQKQKEKEAKEEDKRKREEAKKEEMRRKEDEKLEVERKKQKAASNFVSFFKKSCEPKPAEIEEKTEKRNFMPFEVKADMRMAPLTRRNLNKEQKSELEGVIRTCDQELSKLYISNIKEKNYEFGKSSKTWPYEGKDIILLDDEDDKDDENVNIIRGNSENEKLRAKLFSFNENRRPAYWRTWRKKSKSVNPRKPFAKDETLMDYEVDSDDDWEEEGEGESIQGSDDDKDEEQDEDEYDVDNEFMVPHGYLSDEEAVHDDENEEQESKETQKFKLKILGEQFEAERKEKTIKIKPKVSGCIWQNAERKYPENTPAYMSQFMSNRQAWLRELPLNLTPPAESEAQTNGDNGTPSTSGKTNSVSSARKAQILEEALPDLIRLLHGNTNNKNFIISEFNAFWNEKKPGVVISKSKLFQKIKEIANWLPSCPEEGPMHKRSCYYVNEEIRKKYCPEEDLTLPNTWSYRLQTKKKTLDFSNDKVDDKKMEKDKKPVPLITEFAKKITPEEMQKQLCEKPATSSAKVTPIANRQPKRVSLISVPLEHQSPKSLKTSKASLMEKFLSSADPNKVSDKKQDESCKKNISEDDDIMIVDIVEKKTESSSAQKEKSSSEENKAKD